MQEGRKAEFIMSEKEKLNGTTRNQHSSWRWAQIKLRHQFLSQELDGPDRGSPSPGPCRHKTADNSSVWHFKCTFRLASSRSAVTLGYVGDMRRTADHRIWTATDGAREVNLWRGWCAHRSIAYVTSLILWQVRCTISNTCTLAVCMRTLRSAASRHSSGIQGRFLVRKARNLTSKFRLREICLQSHECYSMLSQILSNMYLLPQVV